MIGLDVATTGVTTGEVLRDGGCTPLVVGEARMVGVDDGDAGGVDVAEATGLDPVGVDVTTDVAL